jgi:hypothetical protein
MKAPFAFLTTRLSAHGKAQHQPLGRRYAGAANNERLLVLLPVQGAAERCAWLQQMVDAGGIGRILGR